MWNVLCCYVCYDGSNKQCMVEVFFVALQNVNLIRKEKAAGIWCLTLLWILMMCKVRMSREHLQSREVSLRPSLAPLRRQKVIKKNKHMSIHRTLSSSSSKKKAAVCPAVLVSQLPVVVCAVPLDVDSTDTLAQFWTSRPLLLLAVRATVVVSPTRGLEQGVVGQRHRLVKQGVQSLLVDSRFREFHLRRSDWKETLKSHHPA